MRFARWRALRRAGIVVAVLSAALGIAAFAAMSSEQTKQGPVVAEGTATSSPDAGPTVTPSTVPAPTTPPDGGRCAQGWRFFDDPVLHYSLCTPPGWGFSDFMSPRPMDAIPGRELEDLHLLSPGAFPWQHGRLPFDAIRTAGISDVELDLLSADPPAGAECVPSEPMAVAGRTFLTCEQHYDTNGLPADSGELRALKVIVPLQRTPADGDPMVQNPRLLVIARVRSSASSQEVDTLWQIVRSIRAY
jgi:hypothetical protein